MEVTPASVSNYQLGNIQESASLAMASKAKEQIELQGEQALALINSAAPSAPKVDPGARLGANIDVYV